MDIRGFSALPELRFYLDSQAGASGIDSARTFELNSVSFIYTPYATDSWSATSKFRLEHAALGGKVRATYDADVGWDFLSVQVKYWNKELNAMVAKFKISGADGGAERFGVSINSNNVLMELEENLVSDLPYDEDTGEYTLVANLLEVKKLSALNFFFDSAHVADFTGTRTVEFTSIEFEQREFGLEIGNMRENPGFAVQNGQNGSADITWVADKESYFTELPVRYWSEQYKFFTTTVTNNGSAPISLGLYVGWEICWYDHVQIAAGETKKITVRADNSGGAASFSINFFWNYASASAGDVTVDSCAFLAEPDEAYGAMNANTGYTVTENANGGWNVLWNGSRAEYTTLPVYKYTSDWLYLLITVTNHGDSAIMLGVYKDGYLEQWQEHSTVPAGRTVELLVKIPDPESVTRTFDLYFFWDFGVADSVGDVTAGIEFLNEPNRDFGEMTPTGGYTVTNDTQGAMHVAWDGSRSDFTILDVYRYAQTFKYLLIQVTNNGANAVELGLYRDDSSHSWKAYTALPAGETVEYLVKIPDPQSVPRAFRLLFYWDYNNKSSQGDVTIESVDFLTEYTRPAVTGDAAIGEICDPSGYYSVIAAADGTTVRWDTTRSVWAVAQLPIGNYSGNYRYLKIKLTPTGAYKFGVFVDNNAWRSHTALTANVTQELLIPIPQTEVLAVNFALRFYFDAGVTSSGSVIIHSAELLNQAPMTVSPLYDYGNEGYDITAEADGGVTVVWNEDRSVWARAAKDVAFYDSDYRYLRVAFLSTRPFKFGVFALIPGASSSTAWKTHTAVSAGAPTEWVIEIPDKDTLPDHFTLFFYFDGGTTSSGNVTFEAIEFLKEYTPPPVPSTLTVGSITAADTYEIVNNEQGATVSWNETRTNVYASAKVAVTNYSAEYLTLKVTLISAGAYKFGVYVNNIMWSAHAALTPDREETRIIAVQNAASLGANFVMNFYFDAAQTSSGSVTVKAIEFLTETPE